MKIIDGDALLETIRNNCYTLNTRDSAIVGYGMFLEGIQQAIVEQPTVNQWIPVSERLPEESDGKVLVTYKWLNYDNDIGVGVGFYWDRTGEWHNIYSPMEGNLVKGFKIIAWQPLPEPFKESEADNDR